MMKRAELEAFVSEVVRDLEPRAKPWLPALRDLYAAGLTTRELSRLFPVSGKWLNKHLRGEGFKARPVGSRRPRVPTADEIEAILKKHRIDLAALPSPKPLKARKRNKKA